MWIGRSTPKDTRRDLILRSVGEVLSQSRLSSLSMSDIAERLGITKGNLYYYFKDKQDILFQCHMRCMDISLRALAQVDPEERPDQQLRGLLMHHLLGIIEGGIGGVLLTDLESLNDQQRAVYVARRDEFEEGVRHLIEAGMAQSVFSCTDVKLAGRTILGAINWVPKWYRPEGALAPEEIARAMSDMLLRTVMPWAAGPAVTHSLPPKRTP